MKMLEELHSIRAKHEREGYEVSRIVLPQEDFSHLQQNSNLPYYDGSLLMDGTMVSAGNVDDVKVETEGLMSF